MRGGEDFWSQIESAIEHARYLIMIVTPDAFESDRAVLRDEWLTARRRGCAVLPVFSGLTRIDFSSSVVPPWLKKLDCYDLDDANHLAKLFNDLRSTPEPRIVPHNVEFPTNFVRRDDEMAAFISLLTASSGGTRAAMITALTGAGGFGKTMLAKALCFEDAVLARYTAGVLWLTVGEGERSPVSLLTTLLQQLGQSPQSADENALFGQWREALRTRECLVVLDDIWRESDAQALVVHETTSAFLITTRIPRVVTAVIAHESKVEEMRAEQAVQVLSLPLAEKSGQFAERLNDLADKAGYWPVMLGLIAGQLRHILRRPGASAEQALDMIEEDLADIGLTAFDRRDKQKRENAVELTMSASLKYLSQNTNHADERYRELAVFPDDEPIEIAVLQDLWHLSRSETRRLVETFADAGLATLDYAQGLRLHDVFLAYSRRRQWTPTNLQKLHCQLLQQWTNVLQLPHNYAWRWYGWHCLQAGEPVRLANALLDLRWLSAKLIHTDLATLLLDCQRAREAIPAQLASFAALHDALKLSAHILVKAPEQLAVQLYGRLRLGQSSELDAMIQQADMILDEQALRPVTQNLRPVGSPLKRTLTGHTGSVYGALELSDGRLLSWGWDKTLRLWMAEGQALAVLSGHTAEVSGALELSDGRLLSWGWDGTLRLWKADGQALAVLSGHTRGYPDGGVTGALELSVGRLLSWSRDKTLRLWTAEGQALAVLSGHTAEVSDALELSDGRLLSWSAQYSSDEKTLRLWMAEGQALAVLSGHTADVSGALELSDGRLLSWSRDKTMRLWTADGQALAVLSGHTNEVNGALELSDGRLLSWPRIYSFADKRFLLWTAEGQELAVLSGHEDGVDGALGLSDGRHKLEEYKSEELLAMCGIFNGFMELSDGRLLSWSTDKTMRLWTTEGRKLAVLRGHEGGVDGALELSDGRLLSWSKDKTMRLWTADGRELAVLRGHEGGVDGALELSDGRLLSWSWDHSLRLWTANGQAQAVLRDHQGTVWGALKLSDGRLLSWSSDKTLRLWTAEGQALAVLHDDEDTVLGAGELSNGGLLAFSDDKTLRLWSGAGKPLAVLYFDANINTVSEVPGFSRLIIGDVTGGIHWIDFQ